MIRTIRLGLAFGFLFLTTPLVQAQEFENASDPRPVYEMRSFSTQIWDMDVDYFSRPIVLVRTEKTNPIHYVEFNINRYVTQCLYWENRCVQYDSQGRCIQYQRVCAQWRQEQYKEARRLEINFRRAAVLQPGQTEKYELDIQLNKPAGDGLDWFRTWLRDESTLAPVKIRRWNELRYDVELK